jgi:hypothetical protein
MSRSSRTGSWLTGLVLGLAAIGGPAIAQTNGAGAAAGSTPPVPAVAPPVASSGMGAASTPTNPPEVIARPGAPAGGSSLSAPLTGSRGGALGGSDQVNPSMGGSAVPGR